MNLELKESSTTSKKRVVGTQISENLYDRLKCDAEADFMSISDLLRKIIHHYYKNNSKN